MPGDATALAIGRYLHVDADKASACRGFRTLVQPFKDVSHVVPDLVDSISHDETKITSARHEKNVKNFTPASTTLA